jgi:hypothetical protein
MRGDLRRERMRGIGNDFDRFIADELCKAFRPAKPTESHPSRWKQRARGSPGKRGDHVMAFVL